MEKVQRKKDYWRRPASSCQIDLFDEADPSAFTTKVLFICGKYFGFKDNPEHMDLMCSSLEEGSYPDSHPFFCMNWVGFNAIPYKHFRLSVHRSVIQNSKHFFLPVVDID